MPDPLLTTSLEHADRHVVVRVGGDIDLSTAPALARALTGAVAVRPPPAAVIADLTDVTFFGSAGVAVLASRHQEQPAGIPLILVVPPTGAVRRTLQITTLDQILTLTEDLEQAHRLADSTG